MQLRINVTNVKIVVFIELNDKDAYCAHENARNARNVENIENIDAFMNMSQLKVTQIWNIRLNEYLKYWSLKALKSVTVTLYKLRMLCIKFIHDNYTLKNECFYHFKLLQQLHFHHHSCCYFKTLRDWNDDLIVYEINIS